MLQTKDEQKAELESFKLNLCEYRTLVHKHNIVKIRLPLLQVYLCASHLPQSKEYLNIS